MLNVNLAHSDFLSQELLEVKKNKCITLKGEVLILFHVLTTNHMKQEAGKCPSDRGGSGNMLGR